MVAFCQMALPNHGVFVCLVLVFWLVGVGRKVNEERIPLSASAKRQEKEFKIKQFDNKLTDTRRREGRKPLFQII